MNTFQVSNSSREMYRNDFDQQFLEDLTDQGTETGHDPHNRIGLRFGFNSPRAYAVYFGRAQGIGIMTRRQAS